MIDALDLIALFLGYLTLLGCGLVVLLLLWWEVRDRVRAWKYRRNQ